MLPPLYFRNSLQLFLCLLYPVFLCFHCAYGIKFTSFPCASFLSLFQYVPHYTVFCKHNATIITSNFKLGNWPVFQNTSLCCPLHPYSSISIQQHPLASCGDSGVQSPIGMYIRKNHILHMSLDWDMRAAWEQYHCTCHSPIYMLIYNMYQFLFFLIFL